MLLVVSSSKRIHYILVDYSKQKSDLLASVPWGEDAIEGSGMTTMQQMY